MKVAQHSSGVALIVSAAILWGTTGTAQSFAPLSLSSYWVGTSRLLVAGVFFVLLLGIRNMQSLRVRQLRCLPWLPILLAALCMAVYNLAFFAGIRATSVAIGTALALGSAPLWAGMLQILITRRQPSPGWWVAVLIAVAGLAMAASGSGDDLELPPHGVILCLLSGLAYAIYAYATRRIVSIASVEITTGIVFMLAGVLALPAAWILAGEPTVGQSDLMVMLWLGIVATGVAYLLFSLGLQFVNSATGVALALIEPVAAFCLAVLVVGERPDAIAAAGLCIVLVGLGLLIRVDYRSA